MKKFSFWEWFKDFVKWIVTRAGLFYAIWTVAGWFFRLPPNTKVPDEINADIVGVFRLTSSSAYIVCGVVVLVLVGATDLARSQGKRRSGVWHTLSRARNWVWLAASTVLGFLVMPIAVGLTGTYHTGKMNPETLIFGIYWIALAAYAHLVGFKDREAYNTITYVISSLKQRPDLRHATEGRLSELLGRFPWVGDISVAAENEVASITVTLPFTLPEDSWTSDVSELRRWNLFNESLMQEWREQAFVVERIEAPSEVVLSLNDK